MIKMTGSRQRVHVVVADVDDMTEAKYTVVDPSTAVLKHAKKHGLNRQNVCILSITPAKRPEDKSDAD